MARLRNPKRSKAFDIYKEYKGGITNKEISKMLEVNEKTISSWKSRDNWNVILQKEINTAKGDNNNNLIKEDIKEVLKGVREKHELTDKQRLFCIYYIQYFNATKAYKEAYKCDYATAKSNSYRLLTNAYIKKEIEKLKEAKINSILIDKYDVLEFLGKVLKADMNDFYEIREGELIKKEDCDGTLIHSIKKGKYGTEIKLYDKTKIVEMLINIFNITPKDLATTMQIKAHTDLLNKKTEEIEGRLF